jgi:CheY-like chemotaxis protein
VSSTYETIIISALILIVIVILFLRIVGRGGSGKAKLAIGELLTFELEMSPTERSRAKEMLEEAARGRGNSSGLESTKKQIDNLSSVRPARILWVDDIPANNLRETVAFEHLGLFVTTVTSTADALFCLRELAFAVVITDLGRRGNPTAGVELIAALRKQHPQLPAIVYTLNASHHSNELLAAGADAVVDAPSNLVAAVLAHRPGDRHR